MSTERQRLYLRSPRADEAMKRETIAIHGGYESIRRPKPWLCPIYQTVAYAFDSADHGAALFNLEAEGFRYTPHQQPDHGSAGAARRRARGRAGGSVREQRAGGGQLCSAERHRTGHQHRLGSAALRNHAHSLRSFSAKPGSHRPLCGDRIIRTHIEKLIDDKTRAVFCESVGNPAGNICDIEALARVAHKHGVPLIVDNTVATPILLRPIEYGADIVVHSLTKFLGGHGTTLGGAIVDSGNFPWKEHASVSRCSASRILRITVWSIPTFREGGVYRALPQRLPAEHRGCIVAAERVSAAAGN